MAKKAAQLTLKDNLGDNDLVVVSSNGVSRAVLGSTIKQSAGGDMLKSTYDPNNVGADSFNAQNIADGSTKKIMTSSERTKLGGIETGADVTDSANVDAAGAVMASDTSTSGIGFVIDEDSFASNSNTKVPTQQSVKAYVDANIGGGGGGGSVFISVGPTGSGATYETDGTADQVQWQAAHDFIEDEGGGEIYGLEGTYNIAAPVVISIPKGLWIRGSGWGTIFKPVNGFNDNVFEFNTTDLAIWAKFSDFKFEGNASNQTAGYGIYAPGALECTFENLWFHEMYDWGIYLYSISESPLNYGHNNRIDKCLFDEGIASPGKGGGIYMEHNDENSIINCEFQFMGGAGARADALADGYCIFDKAGLNRITNNAFVNCYNGVMVRDSGNTVIADNVFDRMRYASCMLRGRQNTVRDNIFYQMGANTGLTNQAVGLYIEYYNSQSVVGNWFISDGTNGVTRSFIKDNSDVDGGGDSQYTDNYFFIDGTLGTGILETKATPSKRNLFRDNWGNTNAAKGYQSVSANYTVSPLDHMVKMDTTGGNRTITLFKASYSYQELIIKKMASANTLTIDADSSETIDGATTKTLSDQYDAMVIRSNMVDGWDIVGGFGL